jgi:hypothetical protein
MTASSPSARVTGAMVYDAARGRVVLFGGDFTNETWEYDGSDWRSIETPVAPPRRGRHAMAYDELHRETILFGGQTFTGTEPVLADTWIYDGASWREAPGAGPPARSGHAMTYDAALERVILFGGDAADFHTRLFDTWEWDGSRWSEAAVGRVPSDVLGNLVFDRSRSRTIATIESRSDIETWEYDGSTWDRISVLSYAGFTSGVAYDEERKAIVLFGGHEPILCVASDKTWEFADGAWTETTPNGSPMGRCSNQMVYDQARRRVVMFGGYAFKERSCEHDYAAPDTWEYF